MNGVGVLVTKHSCNQNVAPTGLPCSHSIRFYQNVPPTEVVIVCARKQ